MINYINHIHKLRRYVDDHEVRINGTSYQLWAYILNKYGEDSSIVRELSVLNKNTPKIQADHVLKRQENVKQRSIGGFEEC